MSIDPQLPKTQVEIATGEFQDQINRGHITSRANDTVKDFTVSLRDIDAAVRYYVINVIKPKVAENGMTVDVPVIYANPERWKSVQRDGFFKDEKDKIILPIIAFKRNSVAKDENYAIDKMDANKPIQFYSFKKKWSDNNRYDNFSLSIGTKPTEEYYSVVIPDYVVMTYDFLVLTEAVDQMNKIVEAILYSEGSYWGDKERFKFRTKIQSYNTSIESIADTQRTVKTTFNLEISGYLVPDVIGKSLSMYSGNISKAFSPKRVIFGFDADTTLDNVSACGNEFPSISSIQGGTIVSIVGSSDVFDYLAVSVHRSGTATNTTTVEFSGVNILQAPLNSGLSTSINNFYFFINGQYIPNVNVSSIVNSGTSVIVVFYGLSFTIDIGDTIIGVGKFSVV